jgi:hypothetical protein
MGIGEIIAVIVASLAVLLVVYSSRKINKSLEKKKAQSKPTKKFVSPFTKKKATHQDQIYLSYIASLHTKIRKAESTYLEILSELVRLEKETPFVAVASYSPYAYGKDKVSWVYELSEAERLQELRTTSKPRIAVANYLGCLSSYLEVKQKYGLFENPVEDFVETEGFLPSEACVVTESLKDGTWKVSIQPQSAFEVCEKFRKENQ